MHIYHLLLATIVLSIQSQLCVRVSSLTMNRFVRSYQTGRYHPLASSLVPSLTSSSSSTSSSTCLYMSTSSSSPLPLPKSLYTEIKSLHKQSTRLALRQVLVEGERSIKSITSLKPSYMVTLVPPSVGDSTSPTASVPKSSLSSPSHLLSPTLSSSSPPVPLYTIPSTEKGRKKFSSLTTTTNPTGLIAVYEMPSHWYYHGSDFVPSTTPLFSSVNNAATSQHTYLVLENLQDPGNVGTLIRTYISSGLPSLTTPTGGLVILGNAAVDVSSPKVIRSSLGLVLDLPCYRFGRIEEFERYMEGKHGDGWNCWVADMYAGDGSSIKYSDISTPRVGVSSTPRANAVVMGNEGNGISESMRDRLGKDEGRYKGVYVPMYNDVESLNVGIAGGLIMYRLKEALTGPETEE